MKFLEKLDIVGYQPVLTIFKNDRFKTKLGIVVGFCTIFSILGIGLYFFVNFILRTELNVIYNQTSEQKSRIDFSSSPIIISLSNGMLEPIKDDFHEIRVNFWNWTRHSSNDTFFSFKTPEIDLEPCDSSRHFGNYAGLLETIPFYSKMKCFTRNFDYPLIGRYGDGVHPATFINIAVNMCNNITTGGKCPSKEVLRPILENTYLSVFYIEYEISHDNFYDPLKPVLKTIIVPINWDIHTRYFNAMKKITHTTDTGFLFEDKVQKYGYSQSTMLPISQIRQGSTLYPDLTIGTFTIIGSAMSDNYFRVYLKGQVLLAQIGGITNTILLIGKLICYIVTKNMFIIDINNLLEFDFVEILSKDKNELNSKNQTQYFNKLSQINSTPIFNNSSQINEIQIHNNSTHININSAVHNSSKIKLNASQLSLKKNLNQSNINNSKFRIIKKPPDNLINKSERKSFIKPTFFEMICPMIIMKRSVNSKNMIMLNDILEKNLSFENLLQIKVDFEKYKSVITDLNLLELSEKSQNNSPMNKININEF